MTIHSISDFCKKRTIAFNNIINIIWKSEIIKHTKPFEFCVTLYKYASPQTRMWV